MSCLPCDLYGRIEATFLGAELLFSGYEDGVEVRVAAELLGTNCKKLGPAWHPSSTATKAI